MDLWIRGKKRLLEKEIPTFSSETFCGFVWERVTGVCILFEDRHLTLPNRTIFFKQELLKLINIFFYHNEFATKLRIFL